MKLTSKKILKIFTISIFCLMAVAAIIKDKEIRQSTIERENTVQQTNFDNIASSTEETTITTEDQEFANKVIAEIQKQGKTITHIEASKKYAYQKITPIVIKITYK